MSASARIAALGLGAAVAMTASFEGLRNYAYLDPAGIPTICLGYTHGVQLGDFKTTAECEALLGAEFLAAVDVVIRCVPRQLTPGPLGAMADAVYNIGPRPVCDRSSSKMARLLFAGEIAAACKELPRWNKARVAGVLVPLPGLTRRREAFMAMCLS